MKNKNVLLLEKFLLSHGYVKKNSSNDSWYIFDVKTITSLGWNQNKKRFSGYIHFDPNKLLNKKGIDEIKISLKELSLNQIENYLKLISKKRISDLIKYDALRKFKKFLSQEKKGELNCFKNTINKISSSLENKILQEYNDVKNIYYNNLNCRTSYQKYYLSFENFYKTFKSLSNTSSRKDIDALNHKVGIELSGSRDTIMNWVEKHRKKFSGQKNKETIFTEVNESLQEEFDEKLYNVDHLFERTIIDINEIGYDSEFKYKHEDFVLLYEESLDKEDFFKNIIKYYIAREIIAVKAINNSSKLNESHDIKDKHLISFYSLKEVKKDKTLRKILESSSVIDSKVPESVKGYLTLVFSFCEKICNGENYSNNIVLRNNISDQNISDKEMLYLLMNPLDTFKNLSGKCNPYFEKSLLKLVNLLKLRYNNYALLKECSVYF